MSQGGYFTLSPDRWSPEQISKYLKINYKTLPELHISPEAIYQYVYRSPHRDKYSQRLRSKRRSRRLRKPGGVKRGGIRNRVSIRARSSEIEARQTPGHWEGDLLMEKEQKSAIGTLVERTTRFVIIVPIPSKDSTSVVNAFLAALEGFPPSLKKSLTYDQGTEMAQHERFTQLSGMQVYFADPGCPWQRGSNENTNGLIREFFPKGTDLNQVSKDELKQAQELLNTRPRKVLGFSTPKKCLFDFMN